MSDRAALLAAIVAHPDEDTPRLVFADWLDEHADTFPTPAVARERARFIRDDIALSRHDEYDPLRLRWELIEKPQREAEAWVRAALPDLPKWSEYLREPLFRRGFPWSVVMMSYLREPLPELPSGSFPVEAVRFNGEGALAIEYLGGAGWRSRLRAIEFEQGPAPVAQLRRLFALDGWERLERLAFARDAIDAPGLRELVALPLFGRLAGLTVRGAPLGRALASALIQARGSGLRELGLVGCRATPDLLPALLSSAAGRGLDALAIGGDRIALPNKLLMLARTVRPPPLRALDLSEDAPNAVGLEAFLASGLVSRLCRLDLAGCHLNSDRARLLARGAFDNLRVLALARNPVGNAGTVALARSPHLAGLRVLGLSYAQVGDEGIDALLGSPLADGLVLLDLTGSPASAEMKETVKARMGDRVRI